MGDLREVINNPAATMAQRLEALSLYIAECGNFPPSTGENNNHIHTIYSFSPYTPSMAALRAKEAGLDVAGSVDHDSIGAAPEMTAACALLKMGCVTGFEVRVDFRHTPFAEKKINNPDSPGLAYMTVQGVPASAVRRVADFLKPVQAARSRRNGKILENINNFIENTKKTNGTRLLPPLSYETDVLPYSMAASGGGVTERHLLYAFAQKLITVCGKGDSLVKTLNHNLKISIPSGIAPLLLNTENPHYAYDLLGLLKSSFLPNVFIQPDTDECPQAEHVTAFARSIEAIPAYAYLGDVEESPTGDKKAEKFEDDFLDALMCQLKKMGYLAITYMPPRNTTEQLRRVRELCRKYGFMEISGVDINSSRQEFYCPQIRRTEFSHLIDATWALVAHEKLASYNPDLGLFPQKSPDFIPRLADRITQYAKIGRFLQPVGSLTIKKAAAMLGSKTAFFNAT